MIAENQDKFRITGLTAWRNYRLLKDQIELLKPDLVAVGDKDGAKQLRRMFPRSKTKFLSGIDGLIQVASHPKTDLVLSAIVGAAGLIPTLSALKAGKSVALANKETLVIAGEMIMREAKKRRVRVIPVDSEHSAIFQCLRGERKNEIRKIVLTASGGPFLGYSGTRLQSVTVKEALNHPNWDMGPKVTIDSATLMNKGLEVIEAKWIFGLSPDKIDVLIHPQSIIHSMVEFQDGSVMGQLGLPDMKVPISYALSYPKRLPNELPSLDLSQIGQLSFDKPDYANFPCLGLAFDALRLGGTASAVLNAVNEETVQSFLNGDISFPYIGRINETVLHSATVQPIRELADVVHADQEARRFAKDLIRKEISQKKTVKTCTRGSSSRLVSR